MLLNGFTTWALMKRTEKKLGENCEKMLCAVLHQPAAPQKADVQLVTSNHTNRHKDEHDIVSTTWTVSTN